MAEAGATWARAHAQRPGGSLFGLAWDEAMTFDLSLLLPSSSPELTGRPGPSDQGWDEEIVAAPRLSVPKLCPEGADQRSEGRPWVSQEGPVSVRVAG